jgi:hypothetical protein
MPSPPINYSSMFSSMPAYTHTQLRADSVDFKPSKPAREDTKKAAMVDQKITTSLDIQKPASLSEVISGIASTLTTDTELKEKVLRKILSYPKETLTLLEANRQQV